MEPVILAPVKCARSGQAPFACPSHEALASSAAHDMTTATHDTSKQHGWLGSPSWAPPRCAVQFDCAARDYCFDKTIKAHEYLDEEDVLRAKVALLADLIRRSRQMLTFTGAGISTAAGIDDYASKAKAASVTAAGKPVVKDWKDARPTFAHHALAALHAAGHLKHWIQQNHDSLPQKAGYPQHALNEIHGSLHDPANPIVPYEGSLRDDLHDWMLEWEWRHDLCLALGTSLSGFNVDRVAAAAIRASAPPSSATSAAAAAAPPSLSVGGEGARRRHLGLVLVNLQATPYDEGCALRLWARIDTVMELLCAELGIDVPLPPAVPLAADTAPPRAPATPLLASAAAIAAATGASDADDGGSGGGDGDGGDDDAGSGLGPDVVLVPFDATTGEPLAHGGAPRTVWDLRVGRRVRLTGGPYEGDEGTVVEKSAAGHYRIRFEDSIHPTFGVKRRPFSLWLGGWWLREAAAGFGIVPGGKIPLVNVPSARA